MPSIFNLDNITVNTYYSENRRHIMILFEEYKNNDFNLTITENNIFDVLDETGTWSKSNSAFIRFEDSSGFIESCWFSGAKPFEIVGKKTKCTISNLNFDLPNGEKKSIDFGYIFSYSIFKEILGDIDNYVENTIYSFWDYYRENNKEKLNSSKGKKKYETHIKNLLEKMKNLFFDDQAEEKEIDDFITNNPIILERCLDIKPDSLLPQPNLKNWIQDNFEQDMKPDLICQNIHEDWIIIDYKRAKRIIKKPKTARADVIAEVHELHTQIKNYREYFNEEKHRDSFFNKTGYNIPPKPKGMGIIGNVSSEERRTFLDSIEHYPQWIDIIPYNDLYKKFENYYKELS